MIHQPAQIYHLFSFVTYSCINWITSLAPLIWSSLTITQIGKSKNSSFGTRQEQERQTKLQRNTLFYLLGELERAKSKLFHNNTHFYILLNKTIISVIRETRRSSLCHILNCYSYHGQIMQYWYSVDLLWLFQVSTKGHDDILFLRVILKRKSVTRSVKCNYQVSSHMHFIK